MKLLESPPGIPSTGRLTSVTGAGGSASFTHNAQERVDTVNLSNNVSRSMTYDSGGRLATQSQNLNGQVEHFGYSYDALGRLRNLTSTHYNTAFGYDSAGRLASERRGGEGAYAKTYAYDLNDNRTRMAAGGTLIVPGGGEHHAGNDCGDRSGRVRG